MPHTSLLPAFQRLRAASRAEPAPGAAARRDSLERLAALVRAQAPALAAAIDADFGGRSPDETRLLEVVPLLRGIRYAQRRLAGWMRDERRPVEWPFLPGRAWVRHEPLGVVGILSPWNYPLLLALSPLTDALAAGNRVFLKPSERTPRFADLLARLLAEAFPPDQVMVATGDVSVAQAFAALPFDHLLFTGSTATGRLVARAAAENLTPVTLELGGKSPALVAADYGLERAARSIAFGKFLNAGQTCIAPDYALVPRAGLERFGRAVIAAAERAYPSLAGNADYSAVPGVAAQQRLAAALAEAEAAGARILRHGGGDAAGRIAPAVVLEPPPGGLLLQEEIFGPILPVLGYDDLEQALALIAARERPLALYCFSGDRATWRRVLDGATSGGATLNGTLLHIAQEGLPFGGIGPSGSGAYHGRDGFRRFSHARAVYRAPALNAFEHLGPPWGRLARWTAHLLGR